MSFMATCPSNHNTSSAWYIDFGASWHFTHHRDWFTQFSPFSDSVVFEGEEYTVANKENVQISLCERDLRILNGYFVPSMKLNLLSVSHFMLNSPQLDVLSAHECTIVGHEDHGLYKLIDIGDSLKQAMAAKSTSIGNFQH